MSDIVKPLIDVDGLRSALSDLVLVDCRFSLADPEQGRRDYLAGHLPGAHYLHLESDLSGSVATHGGRHPLPDPLQTCRRLAEVGIGRDTPVVVYDASRFAFAARLWWMMRALGYTAVRLLDGGIAAWRAAGGELETTVPTPSPVAAHTATAYSGVVDIDGMRTAQAGGALLVDSREPRRYQGLEEPIDPVAGHIPGAINRPWQEVTDESGFALPPSAQVERWSDMDGERELVVYCGSGVTACVNLLSLALAGRQGAQLYAGSWSDWCSYLDAEPVD
jgi:thiosulfate/3-mercaptopyruvate sulfurtransferase